MVAAQASRTRKTKAQAAQTDTEETAPAEDSAKNGASVEASKPKHFGPPKGMYPEGAKLFSHTIKATGETVWFPMEFEQPKALEVFDVHDKPFHVQSWAWMKWANVPRQVQRQVVPLLDEHPDEYLELFNAWMQAVGGVTVGE
jgi:hypothetical protein